MAKRRSYSDAPRKRLSGEKLQKLRARVFTHYGDQCWLCGGDGADTIDHIIPVADGGDDSLDNLRPAHGRKSKLCTGNFSRKRPDPIGAATKSDDRFDKPDGITFGDRWISFKRGHHLTTSFIDYERLGMDHPQVQSVIKRLIN